MTGPKLNPDLLKVPLYIAGKSADEVKEELGLDLVLKLGSNESPLGPSPRALEEARNRLDEAHRYPGVADRDLRRKLASQHGNGLTEQNFLVGNGGTDILRMITQAFVFDGGNTVMSEVTFPMYRILTITFGGSMRQIKATPDYQHDLDAMAEHIDDDTRIVFLCSPNNPSGHIITQTKADDFLSRVPNHVVTIFDESYCDYVTDPDCVKSLEYVFEGRNVLLVRSFSKSAGLANMRVGYMLGPGELTDYVRHAQLPFHTSDIALAAANASLDDVEFHKQNRKAVIEGREHLSTTLNEMGLNCSPNQANFVIINEPPLGAIGLAEALLLKGIIIRPMEAFGMPDAVRITVGSQAENEIFIAALRESIQLSVSP